MVRTFYRQNVYLLLTFIETKILFLTSHNFIMWSQIHSKLSYNKLLSSNRTEAFNLVKPVTALWLRTTCPPAAIIKSPPPLRHSRPRPAWLLHENETSGHIINPQTNSQELFKKQTTPGGTLHLPSYCQHSVTCTPTNKQIQKWFHITLCTTLLPQGLAYSESQAEEVTKFFKAHNRLLSSLEKARVITIALSPFQKGQHFFPQLHIG